MAETSLEQCYDNATHLLSCRHAVGANGRDYLMHCDVLKEMADGRLKIKVYGERYWKDRRDKVSVRYVESSRITKISK